MKNMFNFTKQKWHYAEHEWYMVLLMKSHDFKSQYSVKCMTKKTGVFYDYNILRKQLYWYSFTEEEFSNHLMVCPNTGVMSYY